MKLNLKKFWITAILSCAISAETYSSFAIESIFKNTQNNTNKTTKINLNNENEKQNAQKTSSKSEEVFCFPVASPCHITKRYSKEHPGIDIATEGKANPIYAAQDGVVTNLNIGKPGSEGYGIFVVIEHAGGITTLYAHMSKVDDKIKIGQHVSRGQLLGYVGNTGKSNGVHCHFEVRNSKGEKVDPSNYISE